MNLTAQFLFLLINNEVIIEKLQKLYRKYGQFAVKQKVSIELVTILSLK